MNASLMLASRSFLLVFSGILTFGTTSVAGVVVARNLLIEDYGRFVYFNNILFILIISFGFGLTTKLATEIVQHHEAANRTPLQRTIYTLFYMRLATFIPLILFCTGLAYATGQIEYVLAAISALAAIGLDFFVGIIQAHQRAVEVSITYALQPILYFAAILVFSEISVFSALAAIAGSYIVVLALAVVLAFRSGIILPGFYAASWRLAKASLGFATDTYVIGLLQTAYVTVPVIILGLADNFDVTARFGVIMTVVRIVPMALVPIITTLIYPAVVRHYFADSPNKMGAVIAIAIIGIFSISSCYCAMLLSWGGDLVPMIYGPVYHSAGVILQLLSLMAILLALDPLLTLMLIAVGQNGSARNFAALRVSTLIVTASLAYGAGSDGVIATVAGYYVSAVVGMALQFRALSFAAGWRMVGVACIAVLVMNLLVHAGIRALWDFGGANGIVPVMAGAVTSIGICLLLNVVFVAWYQGAVSLRAAADSILVTRASHQTPAA